MLFLYFISDKLIPLPNTMAYLNTLKGVGSISLSFDQSDKQQDQYEISGSQDFSVQISSIKLDTLPAFTGTQKAIFEPSLPYVLLPPSIYQLVKLHFWQKLLASKYQLEELIVADLISYQYITGVKCSELYEAFENVSISIGKATFYLPSTSYLKDFNYNYYGLKEPHCRIMLAQGKDVISLGNIFIKRYPFLYSSQKTTPQHSSPLPHLSASKVSSPQTQIHLPTQFPPGLQWFCA